MIIIIITIMKLLFHCGVGGQDKLFVCRSAATYHTYDINYGIFIALLWESMALL